MTNYSVDFVIKLALILLLSTLPSLVYLLVFRKAKERWQVRLRRAQTLTSYNSQSSFGLQSDDEDSYLLSEHLHPITKYFIGDTTCTNNAKSPYIRCAINPSGPCEECSHYEKGPHYQ